MDKGTLHGLLTLVALIGFVAIALWAWSDRRRSAFDDAARMPLDDDEGDGR
jgi:cytochrome c oxidase cbb3-type subunit 4